MTTPERTKYDGSVTHVTWAAGDARLAWAFRWTHMHGAAHRVRRARCAADRTVQFGAGITD